MLAQIYEANGVTGHSLRRPRLSLYAAFEKQTSPPADTEKTNTWIVVGVVVPALLVVIIIGILYWKLCRTDKLDFQPDTTSTIQQRQKVRDSVHMSSVFLKL